jgi:DNA-binding NtrC family response regulator
MSKEQKRVNLLLVDDEEMLLQSLKKSLHLRGFNVITATGGEKGVELARSNPVDIALIDLKMPGISGEDTLKILKKEHEFIEVIIFTGHGSYDSAVQCSKNGAYNYLQKPCSMEDLMIALTNAYKQKIMNKKQITADRMNELMHLNSTQTVKEILEKLIEIDNLM